MKKEKLLIKGEGIYVKKEMKKILEGEVFWNWHLWTWAKEGEAGLKDTIRCQPCQSKQEVQSQDRQN